MKTFKALAATGLLALISSCTDAAPEQKAARSEKETMKVVTVQTTKGTIKFTLLPQYAPGTVDNFVKLVDKKFYDGLTFHRVVPGFVIQGGDPSGNGTGGPGYKFADEPVRGEYRLGAVAMANAGPDTNGSQFFVCIDDCRNSLQPLYNLFGYVTSGVEVAQTIKVGDTMTSVTVAD